MGERDWAAEARETVTAGAWEGPDAEGYSERNYDHAFRAALVGRRRWVAWWYVGEGVHRRRERATGEQDGQAGRDAADAALRAAGVVLL